MGRKALGKGLGALLPEPYLLTGEEVTYVEVDRIEPNPYQPRTGLSKARDDELDGLKLSIQANGIIEPLIARRANGAVQLVSGERRWRAARAAGLRRVPVIFRDLEEEKLLEIALVENLQRQSLNPVEEARAYETLIQKMKLSQVEVARRVGKTRPFVANCLRLLRLPEQVRSLLADGKITVGHAKVLLGIEQEDRIVAMARTITEGALSVRELEEHLREQRPTRRRKHRVVAQDPHLVEATERLQEVLCTKVRIVSRKGRGRILIDFHSEEELNRLFELLLAGG